MKYQTTSSMRPLSILDLAAMKQRGEKIASLTAYDASFSAVLDKSGVDVILVGDSLGMVIQGHNSTLPVTIQDMVYHSRCVSQARQRALIIADLPFMSYATVASAATNAALLMQEGGAQMVKLEGAKLDIVRFLVDQGIPVCAHLGLLPQSVNQLGGYRVQGKENHAAAKIKADAQALEQCGASCLVLECIPAHLAAEITRQLRIPVIGIGAGVECDGQVLVLYDMLDLSQGKRPRFSQNYMQNASSIAAAVTKFVADVKQSVFPSPEQWY